MFDAPQVAFQKDWMSNYNESEGANLDDRVSSSYVTNAVTMAEKSLAEIFPKVFSSNGFQVATVPGPNVLELAVYVLNVNVAAPDASMGMTSTYTMDAGSATFAIEARDSTTGQLLGRAVDSKLAGDDGGGLRTRASNEADFKDLFESWAVNSAKGLNALRSASPVDADGLPKN
jgi:hypothetical protein